MGIVRKKKLILFLQKQKKLKVLQHRIHPSPPKVRIQGTHMHLKTKQKELISSICLHAKKIKGKKKSSYCGTLTQPLF